MSAPFVPSPLDCIGRRRFGLYPPIRHPDPNEWVLGKGCRSEVQVVNAHTGRDIWIPRQYIGAVSDGNQAQLVVGLTKVLELRGGTLSPLVKSVIEMPQASERLAFGRSSVCAPGSRPAAVVGIRLEPREGSAMTRALLALCIGAVVIALLAASLATAARL